MSCYMASNYVYPGDLVIEYLRGGEKAIYCYRNGVLIVGESLPGDWNPTKTIRLH